MVRKAEPRGGIPKKARASARSTPERRALRLAEPRVRTALGEAARNRRWLDAVAAAEAAEREAASLAARAARTAPAAAPAPGARRRPLWDAEDRSAGQKGWTLGQARGLLRDGYHVRWVCSRTGWGGYWFQDLLDAEGYARAERPTLTLLAGAA